MQSIQTSFSFSLSSVKPLERLLGYRDYCLAATRRSLEGGGRLRDHCLACEAPVVAYGEVGGLAYVRCPSCGSLYLHQLPTTDRWAHLLHEISRHRHSPQAFHAAIAQSRTDNVFVPKLEWLRSTLRMNGVQHPRLLEVVTPPSDFTALLASSEDFDGVETMDEMSFVSQIGFSPSSASIAASRVNGNNHRVQAAVLLESLDRVDDPVKLLQAVAAKLNDGGLLFLTSLISSGFDLAVLGIRDLYLYPPDRANCFSLQGLERLLPRAGFVPIEISTPGILDVEIVQAHLRHDPAIPLSSFERALLASGEETQRAFQAFLQENRMSSFARIVGKKRS